MITFMRWLFLVGAVLSLLQATLLHRLFQRHMVEPMLRLNERLGAEVPPFMKDPRIQRGWALFMALVFGGLWWFTGTPSGRAWLEQGTHRT